MDLERLELYVERCPVQELRVRDEEGTFFLGKLHGKSRWHVMFQPDWDSPSTVFEETRLQDILALIEGIYPEFYIWLASRFS